MGFKLNINNILRSDTEYQLEVGKTYHFEKSELVILADGIQIWLTKKDWMVLADIMVIKQTRENGKTSGEFVVKYIYQAEEQRVVSEMLRRMYGWE